jgi:hypothetical protein
MSEQQKIADKQDVPGSEGRDPTEGKWVAEPRDPDPKAEGDGITRTTTEKRDGSVNPQSRQQSADDDALDEKVIESAVEDNKLQMDTEIEIGSHKVPGT